MSERLTLPPNPPTVRIITDPELERLRRKNQSLWCSRSQTCLTCGGKGWFKTLVEGEVVEYNCNCLEQMILSLWFTNAGIGVDYQKKSWSDLKAVDVEAAQAALEYLENCHANVSNGRGLILYGSNGVGKTLLATLILKGLMVNGFDGYFFPFTRMLDAFAEGWSDAEDRDWFYKKAASCQVLIIDDIGIESENRSKSSVIDGLDIVIQNRINSGLPTLMTTNLRPEQLEQKYKKHIISRLTGSSDFICMTGKDFRATMSEEMKNKNPEIVEPLRWA